MLNYIMRVYRARPDDLDSISGLIEGIESGQKESFHSFSELQALLANYIVRGRLELAQLVPQELVTREIIAAIG